MSSSWFLSGFRAYYECRPERGKHRGLAKQLFHQPIGRVVTILEATQSMETFNVARQRIQESSRQEQITDCDQAWLSLIPVYLHHSLFMKHVEH
jgi:hypothetical protein